MFKEGLLKGKRILVTGGGTGLGKEMATHYASLGADIVICGRRLNVLEETADEIKSNHDVIPISNHNFGCNQNQTTKRSKSRLHRQIWHRSKALSELFPS